MTTKGRVSNSILRPVGLQDFLLFAAVISLCVVQLKAFASDPGLGWHLLAGEYIQEHGSIPVTDFLTADSFGKPWMLDQWLADLGLATLYSLGSWPLLYTTYILIYLATHFLIVYPFLLRQTGVALLSCFITLLSFKFGQVHFILRPVMLSFFFFAVVYARGWTIYRSLLERRPVSWIKESLIVSGSLLCWANVHPTFVLGLVFLVIVVPALVLERWRAEEDQSLYEYAPYLLFLTGAFLITLVNPFGYHLHAYILWLGQNDFVTTFYSEWQSPNFKKDEGLYTILPLILLFCSMYLWPAKKRIDAFALFTMGLFFVLTLKAVRMLPFWGIVMTFPVTDALAAGFRNARFTEVPFRLLARSFKKIEQRERRSYKGLLAGSLCVFFIVISCIQGRVFLYQGGFGPSPERFPFGVLEPLDELSTGKEPLVIANHMAWGSFLNFYLPGKVLPLIDDRSSVHGEEFYKRFFKAMRSGGNYKEYLEEMKADYVLLPVEHSLQKVWDRYSVYPEVYRDEQAVLYSVKSAS